MMNPFFVAKDTVMNQLVVFGDSKRIEEMFNSISSKDSLIDFRKIIPPDSRCSTVTQWGTRYIPVDSEFKEGKLRFFTFRTPARVVIMELSRKYPDLEFNYLFSDFPKEFGAHGYEVYKNGNVTFIKDFNSFDESFDFSCQVWDFDPDKTRAAYGIN